MNKYISLLLLAGILFFNIGYATSNEKPHETPTEKIESVTLDFNQEVGQSSAGQKFYLGGLSGLFFRPGASAKNHELWTLTDRGPNGGEIPALIGVGRNARSFLIPKFNPKLVKFNLDASTFKPKLVSVKDFKNKLGKGMTGLPILAQTKSNRSITESSADNYGNKVASDLDGMDSEAVCLDKNGNFWVGEEYGPDILKFDSNAKLLNRMKPGNQLPAYLAKRKMNHGFEGIACSDTKVFAILQSPIKVDSSAKTPFVPLVEIDLLTEHVSAVYEYIFDSEKSDKIGDMTVLPDGKLLIIEQNGKAGKDSQRKVFKVSLSKDKVMKELVIDLSNTEFNQSEKIEGIVAIDNLTLLLISDNDFGMSGDVDLQTGMATVVPDKRSLIYRVHLTKKLW